MMFNDVFQACEEKNHNITVFRAKHADDIMMLQLKNKNSSYLLHIYRLSQGFDALR